MGAKKKTQPQLSVFPGTDPAALVNVLAPFRARLVPVEARALLTIPLTAPGPQPRFEGAIVRVRPLAGTDVDVTALLAEAAQEGGAVAVKVLPPPSGPVVVMPAPGTPPPVRLRVRDVVEAMVADSVGVDKEALAALVRRVLDEEGI